MHKSVMVVLVLSFSVAAWAEEHKPVAPVAAPETAELKRQQEALSAENGLAEQRLKKELSKLTAERQRRELENAIAREKLIAELGQLQAEADKLTRQLELLNKKSALALAERRVRLDGELADQRDKLERARVANDVAGAQLAAKKRDLELREAELHLKTTELQAQRTEVDLSVAKLNSDLDLREKRDYWKNRVNTEMRYPNNPLSKGVLTVSDRRIALNGPITAHTADYIAERIDYFNNQSQAHPIFIVIDSSPGGSVAAGFKILRTMEGSHAPVYVVVKTFAASMAAGITTLAKRSFAYPNAIILHHQMAYGWGGNMTEQRERLKEADEWWRRLATPVAAKMGISLDEFVKRMYQHISSGDWREFGDAARKIKWVDEVVEVVREEGQVKHPDAPTMPPLYTPGMPAPQLPRRAEASTANTVEMTEQVDTQGHHYMRLPRLDPIDCYYLFNPDNYYRATP